MSNQNLQINKEILTEIKSLVEQSKHDLAITVNSTMTTLYWNIGKRINQEILQDKRAEYGKQIVATLSRQLSSGYGKGWSVQHLRHCLRFSEVYFNKEIVSTLWREFSWSHIKRV